MMNVIPRGSSKSSKTSKPVTTQAAAPMGPQPSYFDYTVPGYGRKTQALKDTAGDTWYKTQGNQWRNVRTKAVQGQLPSWQAAATPAPVPAAAPAPAPTTTPPTPGTFKSIRDFHGVGENPTEQSIKYSDFPTELGAPGAYSNDLYNWQRDEGIKALRASMSADGGLGSGAQGELTSRFLAQLGGQEADRRERLESAGKDRQATAWNVAANAAEQAKNRQASAAGSDFDNYNNQILNESTRLERQGNTNWSRIMDTLNMILAQNPTGNAYKATDSSAASIQDLGKMLASLAGGGGGGGGGGGSPPPTRDPYAGYYNSVMGGRSDSTNTNSYLDIGRGILNLLNNL